MRQVSVSRLKEGDIIGRSIYSGKGQILLGRGIKLSHLYINRLQELGISFVYIEDELSKDVAIEDVISEENRRQAMATIEQCSEAIRVGKDFSGLDVKQAVNKIIEDILFQKDILLSLIDIRSIDNHMFSHAVSTCVVSTVLGKSMGLNRDKLEALAMGALLHDIGTVNIDVSLLRKRESFTSEELLIYKAHTQKGFDIIRKKHEFSIISAHIAFQHHEWIDGHGYPRGLTIQSLHPLAQIVAISDFYDLLINGGPGQARILPHDAFEIIMASANKRFSHDLVLSLLKNITAYPTGCTVRLNTGEIGIVIDQNKSLPMRPIVRVFSEGNDFNTINAKEYDLIQERTIFIEGILE